MSFDVAHLIVLKFFDHPLLDIHIQGLVLCALFAMVATASGIAPNAHLEALLLATGKVCCD